MADYFLVLRAVGSLMVRQGAFRLEHVGIKVCGGQGRWKLIAFMFSIRKRIERMNDWLTPMSVPLLLSSFQRLQVGETLVRPLDYPP